MGKLNPRLWTLLAGIAAILSVIVFAQPQTAAQATSGERGVTFRLGHFPNVTHAAAMVGISRSTFAQALSPHTLDVKVVNAGPEAMEALLAKELDLCYVGPSPALNTFIKSNGKALRVVAGACSGGASLVARKDSGIRTIRDLAGKRVATPQLGNTQDISLRHFMAKQGLQPKTKGGLVEVLPIKNPDILTQFKLGELDAAWVPEPWATRLVLETGAVRVIDERDLWPGREFTTTVVVARTEFLDAHPDIVNAFVKANEGSIKWIKENPAAAKAVVNEELKRLTGKALPKAVLDESWAFMDFTTDPRPDCFDAFLSAAVECGFIMEPPRDLTSLFWTGTGK